MITRYCCSRPVRLSKSKRNAATAVHSNDGFRNSLVCFPLSSDLDLAIWRLGFCEPVTGTETVTAAAWKLGMDGNRP